MKNILLIVALLGACSSDSSSVSQTANNDDVVADWSLEDGNLTFRTPDMYGDDDTIKPEPSICFVASTPPPGEVWIAEVVSISKVVIPTIDCDAPKQGPQVSTQTIQLQRATGEAVEVIARVQPAHNQLVPGQRVLMGVVPSADGVWVLAAYLLIDGPGQAETTPGMPANFEELRERLEKADCPTPDATAEYIVNSVFDPIDTPCNSSPAPEVVAGDAGL